MLVGMLPRAHWRCRWTGGYHHRSVYEASHGDATVPTIGAPRVGVCVVGQPRSAALTAPMIRRHVLDVLDADAFLVSQLEDHSDIFAARTKGLNQSRSIERLLGPRVRNAVHGTAQQLQSAGLVSQLEQAPALPLLRLASLHPSPPHHISTPYHPQGGKEQQVRWVSRTGLANHMRQQLNHVVCLSLMRHAEAVDGTPYTVYARLRLDSMFFAPLPPSVLKLALVPGTAVVPAGDEWGGGRKLGVCNRMLIGRLEAFAADVYGWEALKPNRTRSFLTGHAFVPEMYQRAILENANIAIVQVKIAYASFSVHGYCRYAEHLSITLEVVGPKLLREHPALCPCKAAAPTACPQAPKQCIDQIQTNPMKAVDPGFCNLARLCTCCI